MSEFEFDKTFGKITADQLTAREYEECDFRGIDFYNRDLTGYRFTSCRFTGCNLSLSRIDDAVMQEISFTDCKILGVRFDRVSRFGFSVNFAGCQLDNSSFRAMKLKKRKFTGCRMTEVDFSECDLEEALFDECDLDRAVFHFTNLKKADFTTAYNYALDPETNQLKKAKFSLTGLPGLLSKYGIKVQ